MDNVNQTLYIPLCGKSFVSKKGIILHDAKAEEIWEKEGFPLKGKSRSKWLAYYMGMRAAVFDRWVLQKLEERPEAVVLHLGCGMDSRCLRVDAGEHLWYDVDFPEVIKARKAYYQETASYKMLAADLRGADWLGEVPGQSAIVLLEGVSMYLQRCELTKLLAQLSARFERVSLLMDCYTDFAARASRYKNPINDVGVTQVYGLDQPKLLEESGLTFLREHDMTPEELVGQLTGMEKQIFRKLYAGSIARKMYRLYEFGK